MRVILLKDVKGVGRKSDIKDVPDGYARNFLIPKHFVKQATDADVRANEREKMEEKDRKERMIKKYSAYAEKLKEKPLFFELKVGDKDEVFGSVTAKDIEKKLRASGAENVEIILERPIKKTGSHSVEVILGGEVHALLTIVVTPENK